MTLPDVQQQTEGFPHISIQKVGIENIKTPLPVFDGKDKMISVMATINSYCSLNAGLRGINMSRIGQTTFEAVHELSDKGFVTLGELAAKLRTAHKSDWAYISASFDFPLTIKTPVTQLDTPKVLPVTMTSEAGQKSCRNFLTVTTTETSLCPCSKEMSLLKNNLTDSERAEIEKLPAQLKEKILAAGFGAHNQKSELTLTVELSKPEEIYIGNLYSILASCASAPAFAMLKRPDEKWVTEVAYSGGFWNEGKFEKKEGGPRFVEDIARLAADKLNALKKDEKIAGYKIQIKNYESIHNDGIVAVATLTSD